MQFITPFICTKNEINEHFKHLKWLLLILQLASSHFGVQNVHRHVMFNLTYTGLHVCKKSCNYPWQFSIDILENADWPRLFWPSRYIYTRYALIAQRFKMCISTLNFDDDRSFKNLRLLKNVLFVIVQAYSLHCWIQTGHRPGLEYWPDFTV